MKKKMTSNVIVTYTGLPKDLYEANNQDSQMVYNVDYWVTDKMTEQDVWFKIIDQLDFKLDQKYKGYICKISTASNWSVWEQLTGLPFSNHDGKFYFARDPKTMSEFEKEIEHLYEYGTHKDAWVEEPTAEESAMMMEYQMKKIVTQKFQEWQQEGETKFDTAEALINHIEQKFGSITEWMAQMKSKQSSKQQA